MVRVTTGEQQSLKKMQFKYSWVSFIPKITPLGIIDKSFKILKKGRNNLTIAFGRGFTIWTLPGTLILQRTTVLMTTNIFFFSFQRYNPPPPPP